MSSHNKLKRKLNSNTSSHRDNKKVNTEAPIKKLNEDVLNYWQSKFDNAFNVVENEYDKYNQLHKLKNELHNIRSKYNEELNKYRADNDRELNEYKSSYNDLNEKYKIIESELNDEKDLNDKLQDKLKQYGNTSNDLKYLQENLINVKNELKDKDSLIDILENDLRSGESLRKKLHNQIQELKGNVRVFARVRPKLSRDLNSQLANFVYPDNHFKEGGRQIQLISNIQNAQGQNRQQNYNFSFDRVFDPTSSQSLIFDEIQQLTQSVLDGYNVCIFAYGQTGSGKSWTMEGGSHHGTDAGMIPRAIYHIFETTNKLKEQGWNYKLRGQFLEIYNEQIIDLLSNGDQEKKHNITHEKNGQTSVSDINIIPLEEPNQVYKLLHKANKKRSVAATRVHEQSSRSSSVFSLKLDGENEITGEHCSSVLNLVDLAGSERLDSTGTLNDPVRLKETQSINKSLSSLSDVISALGSGSHVPYRNSKLTYLLQNSLSSNSKTLMFLNLSPLQEHLQESLCSLRFALKVHSTHIGQAKRTMSVK